MKKLLCLVLVLFFALSIVACGAEKEPEMQTDVPSQSDNVPSDSEIDANTEEAASEDPTEEETPQFSVAPMDCDINTITLQGKTVYLTEVLGDLFEQFMHDADHVAKHRYVYEDENGDVRLTKASASSMLESRHILDEQLITEGTDCFLIADTEGSYEMRITLIEVVGTPLMDAKIETYTIHTGSFFIEGTEFQIDTAHIDELRAFGLEVLNEALDPDGSGAGGVHFVLNGIYSKVYVRHDAEGIITSICLKQ